MFPEKMDENTQRINRLREIVLAGVGTAPSEPVPQDFRSGDVITIDGPDGAIVGRVHFDLTAISVTMLSPVRCESREKVLYHAAFHRRRPSGQMLTRNGSNDGPASEHCLGEAVRILRELYCDWALLWSEKESLKARHVDFWRRLPALEEKDRQRRERVRAALIPLSEQSHALKVRLQNGELRQEEYIRLKEPVRSRICNYQRFLRKTDFFEEEFREELSMCREADSPQTLIAAIVGDNQDITS